MQATIQNNPPDGCPVSNLHLDLERGHEGFDLERGHEGLLGDYTEDRTAIFRLDLSVS